MINRARAGIVINSLRYFLIVHLVAAVAAFLILTASAVRVMLFRGKQVALAYVGELWWGFAVLAGGILLIGWLLRRPEFLPRD
ncbi:hypothetical protein [Brevundimonas sp. AAP58]|uniref:hypothetical protein n=1 Tax=Brevundimonas sp. AAP58 TaxID=1523422 RepID=UPI0012E1D11F|nr:hypothetical protein [Brevundimonas sp. AAP58]